MKPEGSWTRVMFGFRARWSAMVAFQEKEEGDERRARHFGVLETWTPD